MKNFPCFSRLAASLIAAAGLLPNTGLADETGLLPLAQLTGDSAPELIANKAFAPSADAPAAAAPFNGKLVLSAAEMQMQPALENRQVMGRDAAIFPPVTLDFFSHDGDLVPVNRNIITPAADGPKDSFWQFIAQPGRIWSNPRDDEGWSRASFPFALMNRLEQDTHNGVATFAYKDGEVTDLRFQITQQTAPFYVPEHFLAWGSVPASYEAAESGTYDKARDAYREELSDRYPMEPWSALTSGDTAEAVEGFEGDTSPEWVVMHALVRDGTIYRQASATPQGPYPYPGRMRFGVWSVTKSAGPGISMLRLAQKYGDWVYELKLRDYLDIDPPHDGWDDVTFGDALNMASGLGGTHFDANPNDMYADYTFGGSYDEWYRARSEAEKVEMLDKVGNYPWGPGLVARYRDRDMFALGVAMDNFLKSMEGDDADIWRMVADEVFEPIGIHHAPMGRTFESDGAPGQPIMAWGWLPTLDDMAKLAQLLHDRGEHDGKQLLHPARTEALFSGEGTLDQGPVNAMKYGNPRYKDAFHYVPFQASEGDETQYLPFMKGYVGNNVVLAPNGMTAIRISNAWPAPEAAAKAVEEPTSMIETMNRLQSFDR